MCIGNEADRLNPAFFHIHIPEEERNEPVTAISNKTSDISGFSALPNPIKNSITISFYINKPGDVNLNIIDVTGKTIQVLNNRCLQAGSYQFNWSHAEAEGISRGIYFCVLQLNNERIVKKLIVL